MEEYNVYINVVSDEPQTITLVIDDFDGVPGVGPESANEIFDNI
jgi:hypothetical protein